MGYSRDKVSLEDYMKGRWVFNNLGGRDYWKLGIEGGVIVRGI